MKLQILALVCLVCVLVLPIGAYVTERTAAPAGIVQARWTDFPVAWRLNPTLGPNVSGSRTLAEVVQASFDAWDNLTTAEISFVRGADTSANTGSANDGINLIKTNQTPAEYSMFGDPDASLAITWFLVDDAGTILDADILVNPEPKRAEPGGPLVIAGWSLDSAPPSDKYDLQSVMTHEIGHFVGLDHTNVLAATMFPTTGVGVISPRQLSMDDIAGVSSIYPSSSFLSKGTLTGTVRLTTNAVVYGALVVAVNSSGQPVASAVTDPQGRYTIRGLDAGNYTVYAEPMDSPVTLGNFPTLENIYSGQTPQTNFTTRFR